MVTFAQAQERAEEWINGDVPAYQHREVRVREFELGFVVWAEDREGGPRLDGGAQRLVIARDSGEATLWPALPVGEVVRRYEEEYGRVEPAAAAAPPPARVDLNQTSFLLTPPEWLQEAADRMGIPDRRGESGAAASAAASAEAAGSGPLPPTQAGVPLGAGAPGTPAGATPWAGTDTNADTGDDRSVPLPATVFAPPLSGSDDDTPPPASPPDAKTALMAGGSALPRTTVGPAVGVPDGPVPPGGSPAGGTPPPSGAAGGAGYGYPGGPGGPGAPATPPPPVPGVPGGAEYGYPQGPGAPGAPGTSTPPPPSSASPAVGGAEYGYPQGPGGPGAPLAPGTPPPPSSVPGAVGGAGYGYPRGPGGPGTPPGAQAPGGGPHGRPPLAPDAGDIADAATSKAAPPPRRGGGASAPPPPGAPGTPGARPGAPPPPGASGGYVPTQLVSSLGPDGPEGLTGPGTPGGRPPGGVHHAATMLADPGQSGGGAPHPPAPPGAPQSTPPHGASAAPGAPGVPPGAAGAPPHGAPAAPGAPGMPPGAPGMPAAPGAPGAVHHAATMLAAPPSGGPHTPPPPPGAPGVPGVPPGTPPPTPPGAVPPPGMPPAPGQAVPGQPPMPGQAVPGQPPMPGQAVAGQPPAPGQAVPGPPPPPGQPPMPGQAMPGQPPMPGQRPGAYGYPQQGQPTVGPGYQAVLRYRAHDGSEQQLIRRSAPGTPHPEWQIFHELRAMNVPPDRVLELHTELESCQLPGAYCARMIREQWPQARIASIAPYGTDHASRQQGMQQLLAHQGELHQVADGPARPGPVRAPLPPVQPVPPIPPEGIAQELAAAFGPGLFRFEQAAVSRQGVPPVVAHTLVVAGLPMDMGPFFWAQAQPGRPVPTLAELAAERGVQPASDAGSYLVMGSDFGKAVCVQYGTANIVAVPVEGGPGGAPVAPQFVNTGLPEFARCLALLGRMWRLRFGLNQEQAGRWTVDFQAQLAALDPAALGSPESWWSVLLEQMWDGLL
ncbi:SUKH-4 family immunity protein [Streptomyces sp. NPDC007920]|uniref:SUKH-4 family immunity protein n=1 Tax=Streptomyces sp. NPDC007920 TaxID=3364794 RepID=UPI0036E6E174